MFQGVALGIKSYFTAHKFIKQHKLWAYVLAPGFMNLLLFGGTILIGLHYSDALTIYFLDLLGMNEPTEDSSGWLSTALRWIFMVIFRLLFLLFYLYLYKYIVLIIMSPVLALLAEKVDKILTHNDDPFEMNRFISDVLRGVGLAIRNLAIEFTLLFALFLLSFVPVLQLITPFLMLSVEFYFFGFSMIDYSNERKRMSVKESAHYVNSNKGLSIAIGGMFYLLLLAPIIGLMIGPTYGVVAAALATHNETGTNLEKTSHG
ncbi:MAG: EI24 domain-containing protein [Flavobacteriales bacterium]|nr:EI24 domain-containing protein [Flavobacteriales bacterium]